MSKKREKEIEKVKERESEGGRGGGVLELGNGSEETLCIGGGGLGWQKEDREWK